MAIHVVAYATHNEGNYTNLINNKYDINVITLGMNTKWQGFKYKFVLLYNYIKNLPDNDIVISLDGFDVWINGPLNEAIAKFKKMNVKTLFSREQHLKLNYLTKDFVTTISKKAFSVCKNNVVANSGIYMGYIKYIKIFLKDALSQKCNDDQRILNSLCSKYDFIEIDYDNLIFKNVGSVNDIDSSSSTFIQVPGQFTFKRYIIRGLKEYPQFFLKELIVLLAIISCLHLDIKNKST